MSQPSEDFITDCMLYRGRVLTGVYAHWCFGWDELPVDETCDEWPCECADDLKADIEAKAALAFPPSAPTENPDAAH